MSKKKLKTVDNNKDCVILNLFSDQITLLIFQQLDTISLAKVSCVCNKWYRISKDKELTKNFDLRLKPLTLIQAWNVLRRKLAYNTTSVHIRGLSKPSRPIEILSQAFIKDLNVRCPNIVYLSLEFFDFRTISLDELPRHLQFLSLRGSMLTMGWFKQLKSTIIFKSLKHLDLRDCTKLNNSDLEALSYINSIEKLYLVNCYRISARGIPSITSSMKNLNTIDLSSCPATNTVVMYYLSRLNLVEVRLRFCHLITDDGIRKLLNGNVQNSLKILDIFTCHELTDKSLEIIHAQTTCLKFLDIGGNNKYTQIKINELCNILLNCQVKCENDPAVSECLHKQLNNFGHCTKRCEESVS